MLALKNTTGASHLASPKRLPSATISNLPPEILDVILRDLYQASYCRLYSVLPSSRVCRQFRASALPLLFESASYAVRETKHDIRHPSFHRLIQHPHLLNYVRTLSIRKSIRKPLRAASPSDASLYSAQLRLSDITVLEDALQHTSRLDSIRLSCALVTAVDVLRLLPIQSGVTVIVDQITLSRNAGDASIQHQFLRLLQGRTAALARTLVPRMPKLQFQATEDQDVTHVVAAALESGGLLPQLPLVRLVGDHTDRALLTSLALLDELWIGYMRPTDEPWWSRICNTIPWHQLRRLRVSTPDVPRRMHDILPRLTAMEDLRLEAIRTSEFHAKCAYSEFSHDPYSDANDSFWKIDFDLLPHLRILHIEGICNHVPIENLVGPKLQALRLHRPDSRFVVISPESQRSPSDLVIASRIAPGLESLDLDIGYIDNLWHPTAIPGVDVNMEIYRFISALSNFRSLRRLRLFPPYVDKEPLVPHPHGLAAANRQPASDTLVMRMFHEVRNRCPSLDTLSISACATRVRAEVDFNEMCWEVTSYGDKTLMTTRQLDKDYELRQVWVGDRRLTMETRKHAYSKKWRPTPDDWLLTRSYQA